MDVAPHTWGPLVASHSSVRVAGVAWLTSAPSLRCLPFWSARRRRLITCCRTLLWTPRFSGKSDFFQTLPLISCWEAEHMLRFSADGRDLLWTIAALTAVPLQEKLVSCFYFAPRLLSWLLSGSYAAAQSWLSPVLDGNKSCIWVDHDNVHISESRGCQQVNTIKNTTKLQKHKPAQALTLKGREP